MSGEMIERVAKAIYESRNGAGCRAWGTLPGAHKAPYLDDARAALSSIREPTPGMVDAAHAVPSDHAKHHWRAMIDAALGKSREG